MIIWGSKGTYYVIFVHNSGTSFRLGREWSSDEWNKHSNVTMLYNKAGSMIVTTHKLGMGDM